MKLQKEQENRFEPLSVASQVAQRKPNTTGLPDSLKSGIERLSGHSMDDVKVHYNSSRPAQLQAHAFAQGNQIHLAPGQEKHLPHEAWHVVQQKQGRVRPTMQLKSSVHQRMLRLGRKGFQVKGSKSREADIGNLLNLSNLTGAIMAKVSELMENQPIEVQVGETQLSDSSNIYQPEHRRLKVKSLKGIHDLPIFAHESVHAFDHLRGVLIDSDKTTWVQSEIRAMMVQCIANIWVHYKTKGKFNTYAEIYKIAYENIPDGGLIQATKKYMSVYKAKELSDKEVKVFIAQTLASFLGTLIHLIFQYYQNPNMKKWTHEYKSKK